MRVRFWGTRGSIPAPGPATAVFGGNTTCVELSSEDGETLVLDAGTGIRALGQELMRQGVRRLRIALTHAHWDHVQGLPFFEPLRDPGSTIELLLPPQLHDAPDLVLEQQFHPIFFPVRRSEIAAKVSSIALRNGVLESASFALETVSVDHPGGALAVKATERSSGASVAFVPDNELRGGAAQDELVALSQGASLLIHDAMYTEAEYAAHVGWGHSSYTRVVQLAKDAAVSRLALTHHHPDRSDSAVQEIVADARRRVAAMGSTLEVFAAQEGQELRLT